MQIFPFGSYSVFHFLLTTFFFDNLYINALTEIIQPAYSIGLYIASSSFTKWLTISGFQRAKSIPEKKNVFLFSHKNSKSGKFFFLFRKLSSNCGPLDTTDIYDAVSIIHLHNCVILIDSIFFIRKNPKIL